MRHCNAPMLTIVGRCNVGASDEWHGCDVGGDKTKSAMFTSGRVTRDAFVGNALRWFRHVTFPDAN